MHAHRCKCLSKHATTIDIAMNTFPHPPQIQAQPDIWFLPAPSSPMPRPGCPLEHLRYLRWTPHGQDKDKEYHATNLIGSTVLIHRPNNFEIHASYLSYIPYNSRGNGTNPPCIWYRKIRHQRKVHTGRGAGRGGSGFYTVFEILQMYAFRAAFPEMLQRRSYLVIESDVEGKVVCESFITKEQVRMDVYPEQRRL